jgi:hypothetical protein
MVTVSVDTTERESDMLTQFPAPICLAHRYVKMFTSSRMYNSCILQSGITDLVPSPNLDKDIYAVLIAVSAAAVC